jgi:atypical dual specificity phosphatase
MPDETLQLVFQQAREDAAFREQLLTAPLVALEGYDLTRDERLRIVLPNFGWLLEHELAGVSLPRSEDALSTLRSLGVAALLSLSEHPLPPELLRKHDLLAEHLPLADFSAPTVGQAVRAVAVIDTFLREGRPVAVHCGAGLGRTGTILACYLVSRGHTARDAVAEVRARRPGSVETREQEAAVALYESRVRGEREGAVGV